MAITVVQAKKAAWSSGATIACPLTTTVTGHSIVVIAMGFVSGGAISVTGVALSTGAGTFTKLGGQVGTANYCPIEVWIAPNITGGTSPNCNVTFSPTPAGAGDIFVYELAGVPTTTTQDGTAAGAAQAAATACVTPNITTTNAGSIIFGSFSPAAVFNAGSWTNQIGTSTGGLAEYQIETTTQTNVHAGATQSSSSVYAAHIFALQPVGVTTLHFAMAIADTSAVTLSYENNRHWPVQITDTSAIVLTYENNRHWPTQITDTSTVALTYENNRHWPVQIADTSTVTLNYENNRHFLVQVGSISSVLLGIEVNRHFPVTIADTSTVALTYENNRHWPVQVADISSVLALGYRTERHWLIQVADTSSVTLGFHVATTSPRFPIIIADTSNVSLGFHLARHFRLAVTDTSNVQLNWSLAVIDFPLAITGTSTARISYTVHFLRPNPMPPYAGDPQESEILVPAWIRYREEQWEDGPWVMPPYAWIFPQPIPMPVEERGTDSFHHEWLKTHRRPAGPRRMGDANHRPQSVKPTPKPTPPIKPCLPSHLTQGSRSLRLLPPGKNLHPRKPVPK